MPLVILFFLAAVAVVVVVPLVALSKARAAERGLEELSRRLQRLEREREMPLGGETRAVPVPEQPLSAPPPTAATPVVAPASASLVEARIQAWEVATPKATGPVVAPSRRVMAPREPVVQPQVVTAPGQELQQPAAPAPGGSFLDLPLEKINWEQFMGVRLFAWLGGLALFLAAAFFVKYSFEHNLIPPEVRVAIGFVVGIGVLLGGIKMPRPRYQVTSHTLCGAGVVILYAITFACRAVYHFEFFGPAPTFLLMALITATAFLTAVRLDARLVAVLGMLGGFLTPILLSTGEDRPITLFAYVALLNVGLISVASVRRWDWLNLAAALGTVAMECGWVSKFFPVATIYTAMGVFLGFNFFFLAVWLRARRRQETNSWLTAAALLAPAVTILFTFVLVGHSVIGPRPGIIFCFILGADLCLLALSALSDRLGQLHLWAGVAAFVQLASWTSVNLTAGLLYWALAGYFAFALLHAAFPVWLNRRFPERAASAWAHAFPALALLLMLIPMVKLEPVSFVIWPAILLVDLLAIGFAALAASVVVVFAALVLTVGLAAVWLACIPAEITGVSETLIVIGGFAALFTLAGVFAARRIVARQAGEATNGDTSLLPFGVLPADVQRQIPALSGILPFLLLIMAVARLPIASPTPVFGLALLLVVLLLGLTRVARMEWLSAVALGCVFLLEYAWQTRPFPAGAAGLELTWLLVFYGVFTLFPFVFQRGDGRRALSWISSALAGPAQFYLIYRLTLRAWPNDLMGLIPAAFALPALAGLVVVSRQIPATQPERNTILAWFGGVTLFFITLIFPIQFERQWLTLAWALEGVALFWLFFRVPHRGLRYVGFALLLAAFARLALNPAALSYHPRAATAILNWYLYTYGTVALCLFCGARLLAPPDHLIARSDPRPTLRALGVVLAFLLLNIEIADYFGEAGAATLTFSFVGNFARDMSYSIGWGLFALVLLVSGILRQAKSARYAGLGLLGVTLMKLFLHDLDALEQLYRVVALVVVAAIAIFASFLYQKFLAGDPAAGAAPDLDRTKPRS